jgi:hypothetical protein
MIEVFKTNITDRDQANMLISEIHKAFPGYCANFDLNDCDNILRIVCVNNSIQVSPMIDFLKNFGCVAEVLLDNAA